VQTGQTNHKMKNLLLPFRTSLHSGRDAGLRTFDEITFSGLRTRLHSGHHGSCIHSEFRKSDQEIKQIKSDQEIKLINWENRNRGHKSINFLQGIEEITSRKMPEGVPVGTAVLEQLGPLCRGKGATSNSSLFTYNSSSAASGC
jgi:hypothetical protein